MTYGTDYFVTRRAAIAYYAEYGYDASDVDDKIAHGEIHIGKPVHLGACYLIHGEMRWAVRECR